MSRETSGRVPRQAESAAGAHTSRSPPEYQTVGAVTTPSGGRGGDEDLALRMTEPTVTRGQRSAGSRGGVGQTHSCRLLQRLFRDLMLFLKLTSPQPPAK